MLQITKSLLTIKEKSILDQLIPLKVIHTLSKWIHEYKEEKLKGMEIPPDEIKIIIDIVNLCQKVDFKKNDLKNTKIGKNINKLGKALKNDNEAKKYCENIVSKWRKMIDGDDERNEGENEFMRKKTKRENYDSNKNLSNNNFPNKYVKLTNFNLISFKKIFNEYLFILLIKINKYFPKLIFQIF